MKIRIHTVTDEERYSRVRKCELDIELEARDRRQAETTRRRIAELINPPYGVKVRMVVLRARQ